MIIFINGEDSFRIKKRLGELITEYKESKNEKFDLRFFDANEDDFSVLINESRTLSIFNKTKVFIISNVFSSKSFQEKFLEKRDSFKKSKDVFLFYGSGKKVLATNPLLIFFKKNAKNEKFDFLKGEGLNKWIKERFEYYGKKIDHDILKSFSSYLDNDLWRIDNEIQKIVNFKRGEEINKEDIELLIEPQNQSNIFNTLDAISKKDKKKAYTLLKKSIENGDNPYYLLTMIVFQFRNILIVKDLIERGKDSYNIQKITKLNPYVLKKTLEIQKGFKLSEIKKIYHKIFRVDFLAKTGGINLEIALDLLISEV